MQNSFEGGDAAPCLYVRKNEKGIVIIAIYMDENLLNMNKAAMDKTVKLLQNEGFNLKIEDNLKDCLSCSIHISKSGREAWLGQLHLMANLNQKFGKLVEELHDSRYTMILTFKTCRLREEDQYGKAVSVLIWHRNVTIFSQALKTRHCECSTKMYQST